MTTGITSLSLAALVESPDPLPVGADGFFVIAVGTRGIAFEEVLAQLTFDVRTVDDQPVTGTARMLPAGFGIYVAWQSDSPLGDGTLNATVSAAGADGALTLSTPLQVLSGSIEDIAFSTQWAGDVELDFGTVMTCTSSSSCSYPSYFAEVSNGRAIALEAAPTDTVFGAWLLTPSERSDGGRILTTLPNGRALVFSHQGEWRGTLTFADAGAASYCVSVDVRDLRTDTAVSRDVCTSLPAAGPFTNTDTIRDCYEPPPGLEQRWCKAQGLDPSCRNGLAGAGGLGSSGFGGTGGLGAPGGIGGFAEVAGSAGHAGSVEFGGAGAGSGGGSTPDDVGEGGSDDGDDTSRAQRTDRACACRAAGAGSAGGLPLSLVGLGLTVAFLRRLRRSVAT